MNVCQGCACSVYLGRAVIIDRWPILESCPTGSSKPALRKIPRRRLSCSAVLHLSILMHLTHTLALFRVAVELANHSEQGEGQVVELQR